MRGRMLTDSLASLAILGVWAGIVLGQVQPPGKTAPPIRRPPGFQPKAPGFVPGAPGFQPKTGVPPQAKVAPPPAKKAPKLPEPEDVALETRDGMTIKATYYPGTAKKEAACFILIHGLEGQRGEYHGLATFLQSLGHASIAPDLRGHGQSKVQKRPDGSPLNLDPEKLTKPNLEEMLYDIQACKRHLMEKNNAGDLNIEQLCVVGAELGTILAVRFAAYDWSLQDLPAYKQGKDVKALVLLSPVASVKGMTIREALQHPAVQSQLSIMFIAGLKDSKATAEAKKLYNSLQAHHPKMPDDKEQRAKSQELFLVQPDVNLSGTNLLKVGPPVLREIVRFVDLRLLDRKAEFAWQDRTNPLDN